MGEVLRSLEYRFTGFDNGRIHYDETKKTGFDNSADWHLLGLIQPQKEVRAAVGPDMCPGLKLNDLLINKY